MTGIDYLLSVVLVDLAAIGAVVLSIGPFPDIMASTVTAYDVAHLVVSLVFNSFVASSGK
jgi:hypothetical protein